MKKLILVIICFFGITACAPTIATKYVQETRHPDGSKTVVIYKELKQHLSKIETEASKDVIDTLNSVK